jgi:hypothetical protein
MSADHPAGAGDSRSGPIGRWLLSRPDGTLLRWLFRGVLAAAVTVLAMDLVELRSAHRSNVPELGPWGEPAMRDVLPPARKGDGAAPARDAVPSVTGATFDGPARFELVRGGRLRLEGAIDPGSADRFAQEVAVRGDYVETVVLSSPGGSVRDALEIGRLIREQGYATEVEPDGYCASSCPLIFAAGVDRRATSSSAIGVHQVFSTGIQEVTGIEGMDNAQRTSAEVQRYLIDMGIDPRVWIHAMETPPTELFYFSADELVELDLATEVAAADS